MAGTLRCNRPGETGQAADADLIVPVVSPALNTVSGSHHAPDTRAYVAVVASTLNAAFGTKQRLIASTGDVAHCLNAGAMGRIDFETETMIAHALRGEGFDASEDGTGRGTPLVPVAIQETHNADAYEADASSILSTLRGTVGEETFRQWGLGVLAALQSPEVLRSWLHGERVSGAPEQDRPQLVNGALARAEHLPTGSLRELWGKGPDGRSPQGRELAQQLAKEFGTALPVLSHQNASYAVRRLTPREAERLQGFPDDYTAIPYRGKSADLCPDGPRYKALGNSMAVNIMRWLGLRVQAVDAIIEQQRTAADPRLALAPHKETDR